MVYVIVVNFNGWVDTIECLNSILSVKVVDLKIIVVDNSDNLESLQKIDIWSKGQLSVETRFPEYASKPNLKYNLSCKIVDESNFIGEFPERVIVVKQNQNLGFAAANNVALRYLLDRQDYDFVWLLNNDTVVKPDALTELVRELQKPENSNAGMCGGLIMEYYQPNLIQSAGGGRICYPLAYPRLVQAGASEKKGLKENLHFVAGTCILLKKAFLKNVGLMEEKFFLYFEEPDWFEMGKRRGWNKLAYCENAVIFHKGGKSTGGRGYSSEKKTSTPFSDFYFQRAKVLFTKKHYPHLLFSVYISFILVIFFRIIRGQFRRIPSIVSVLLMPSRHFKQ